MTAPRILQCATCNVVVSDGVDGRRDWLTGLPHDCGSTPTADAVERFLRGQ